MNLARHRIALGPHDEGGHLVADQPFIQVNRALHVVVGRAGETGGYRTQDERHSNSLNLDQLRGAVGAYVSPSLPHLLMPSDVD